MAREIKYYIVAANALPEIFVKVAEAKRMMQTGEADTCLLYTSPSPRDA